MRKLVVRWSLIVLLGVGALGAGALRPATVLAAQGQPKAWSIAVTASLTGFRGAASAASDADTITVRPGQGIAVGISGTRRWHPWTISLGLSYLPTHVEAVSTDIAVQDRTERLERVRLALMVSRHVLQIGTAGLELRAGPALDNWSADGKDGRTVVGGDVAVAVQLPAGPVTVENVLSLGWSPGPFRVDELPESYERKGLRSVTAGIGIRVGR